MLQRIMTSYYYFSDAPVIKKQEDDSNTNTEGVSNYNSLCFTIFRYLLYPMCSVFATLLDNLEHF